MRRAVVGAVLALAISACGGTTPVARAARVPDHGAALDDSAGDAHERTTDVAEHRPIAGRVRARPS